MVSICSGVVAQWGSGFPSVKLHFWIMTRSFAPIQWQTLASRSKKAKRAFCLYQLYPETRSVSLTPWHGNWQKYKSNGVSKCTSKFWFNTHSTSMKLANHVYWQSPFQMLDYESLSKWARSNDYIFCSVYGCNGFVLQIVKAITYNLLATVRKLRVPDVQ